VAAGGANLWPIFAVFYATFRWSPFLITVELVTAICRTALVALVFASTGVLAAVAADDRAEAVRARIEARVKQDNAEAGVAFRTLDGRDEVLLVADTPFHAASTMKVPVLVELYRQVDAGRLSMDDPLPVVNRFASIVDGSPYTLDPADDSDKGALYKSVGSQMPVRELAEAMITVSSNLATNLLIEKLGVANVQQALTTIGVDGMKVVRGVEDNKAYEQGLINTTTARGLLMLLEAIGRGRAASDASCGEMIAILRRQQSNEGIPAGLPPGTPVAHKTGQITRIHHDAGIVYTKRPYVLVVLVKGVDDEKQSAALIRDISKLVYEEYGKS
jgi:beta-lactamase class A